MATSSLLYKRAQTNFTPEDWEMLASGLRWTSNSNTPRHEKNLFSPAVQNIMKSISEIPAQTSAIDTAAPTSAIDTAAPTSAIDTAAPTSTTGVPRPTAEKEVPASTAGQPIITPELLSLSKWGLSGAGIGALLLTLLELLKPKKEDEDKNYFSSALLGALLGGGAGITGKYLWPYLAKKYNLTTG